MFKDTSATRKKRRGLGSIILSLARSSETGASGTYCSMMVVEWWGSSNAVRSHWSMGSSARHGAFLPLRGRQRV